MRVALACDWFLPRVGGIELHLRDLALALRDAGVDARIVTTTRGEPLVDGVPVHRVRTPLDPGAGVAYLPGMRYEIERLIRDEAFDVVHAHASVVSPVAYTAAVAARRAGVASLVTFHSMLYRSSFVLGASEALFSWSERGVVLSAVSSVVAAQVARWIPGASVGVLPNGLDTSFWRAPSNAVPDGEIFALMGSNADALRVYVSLVAMTCPLLATRLNRNWPLLAFFTTNFIGVHLRLRMLPKIP